MPVGWLLQSRRPLFSICVRAQWSSAKTGNTNANFYLRGNTLFILFCDVFRVVANCRSSAPSWRNGNKAVPKRKADYLYRMAQVKKLNLEFFRSASCYIKLNLTEGNLEKLSPTEKKSTRWPRRDLAKKLIKFYIHSFHSNWKAAYININDIGTNPLVSLIKTTHRQPSPRY